MKKLSVIVPVYNKELFVEKCIKSILTWADCPKTKLKTKKNTIYSTEKTDKAPDIVCAAEENRVFGQPVGGDCPKTKLKTRKTTIYSVEKTGKTLDIVCAADENRVFGQPGGNDYEFIIVDDGSTDKSAKIVDKFKSSERVKIIHKENGGVSSARNEGLKVATGEYITFVDADDEVVEGSLDKVMSCLDGRNDICIAGAVQEGQDVDAHIFEQMELQGEAALTFILTGGTKEKRIPKQATKLMSGCKEKFYKKSFLDSIKASFDEELGRNEDVLWSCFCYYWAESILFLPTIVYINKEDENGITKGMNIKKIFLAMKLFIDKFNCFFLERLDSQTLSNFYFHQSLVITYEAYRAFRLNRISRKEFKKMMTDWYNLDACEFMLDHLKSTELSMFKKIAFYMMGMKMYDLVGFEMTVHHKKK